MYTSVRFLTAIVAASLSSGLVKMSVASAQSCNQAPTQFVSDACSSLNQSDHVTGASYVKCCFIHDIGYYKGGSEKRKGWVSSEIIPPGASEPTDKEIIDDNFRQCIHDSICAKDASKCESKFGLPSHAARTSKSMLAAVSKLGDTSGNCKHNDDWQWGYGWKNTEGCTCRRNPNLKRMKNDIQKAERIAQGTDGEIAQWIMDNLPAKTFIPRTRIVSELQKVIDLERGN